MSQLSIDFKGEDCWTLRFDFQWINGDFDFTAKPVFEQKIPGFGKLVSKDHWGLHYQTGSKTDEYLFRALINPESGAQYQHSMVFYRYAPQPPFHMVVFELSISDIQKILQKLSRIRS